MRQALHIFKKDLRQFRYLVALILVWTIVFVVVTALAWSEPASSISMNSWAVSQSSTIGLPLVWCLALVLLIHAEPLPGDRQFWLTRPYSRASLFTAKALFVVSVILLPLFLAQAAILTLVGLPVMANLVRLLWEQLLVLSILILPAAVLAAVTTSLPQFIISGFVVHFVSILVQSEESFLGVAWFRIAASVSAAVVCGGLVLWWQYRRRGTTTARVIVVGGVAASCALTLFMPWRVAFKVQSELAGEIPGVTASLIPPATRAANEVRSKGNRGIQLYLRVSGLPDDVPFVCRADDVTITGSRSETWHASSHVGDGAVMPTGAQTQTCPVGIPTPARFLDAVADEPVRIQAALYITVFGSPRETAVPIDDVRRIVPELGACQGSKGDPNVHVDCRLALRALGVLAFPANSYSPYGGNFSYSPFPAELRIQPVSSVSFAYHAETRSAVVGTSAPIAHLKLDVDVPDVHLPDYEVGG